MLDEQKFYENLKKSSKIHLTIFDAFMKVGKHLGGKVSILMSGSSIIGRFRKLLLPRSKQDELLCHCSPRRRLRRTHLALGAPEVESQLEYTVDLIIFNQLPW